MKKFILLIISLYLFVSLEAQDNILEQIKRQNAAVKSFISDVSNIRLKKGKQDNKNGKIFYIANDKFAVYFETNDYMVINENQMKIDLGMFHGKFRLKKNKFMRSLSNVFLYGFQGRCKDLADENDYSIEVQEHIDLKFNIEVRKWR